MSKNNYVFAVHIDQLTSKHALFKRVLFAGFDNTCDFSAVLGILANSSVFHAHLDRVTLGFMHLVMLQVVSIG